MLALSPSARAVVNSSLWMAVWDNATAHRNTAVFLMLLAPYYPFKGAGSSVRPRDNVVVLKLVDGVNPPQQLN